MRGFWPAAETAQASYEALREVVMAGGAPLTIAAARFERRGMAGLIAWPTAEPVFCARLSGVPRPAWSPYADPRSEVLASGYQFVLASFAAKGSSIEEAQ